MGARGRSRSTAGSGTAPASPAPGRSGARSGSTASAGGWVTWRGAGAPMVSLTAGDTIARRSGDLGMTGRPPDRSLVRGWTGRRTRWRQQARPGGRDVGRGPGRSRVRVRRAAARAVGCVGLLALPHRDARHRVRVRRRPGPGRRGVRADPGGRDLGAARHRPRVRVDERVLRAGRARLPRLSSDGCGRSTRRRPAGCAASTPTPPRTCASGHGSLARCSSRSVTRPTLTPTGWCPPATRSGSPPRWPGDRVPG